MSSETATKVGGGQGWGSANRRDVALQPCKPLAPVVGNTLSLCCGSPHLRFDGGEYRTGARHQSGSGRVAGGSADRRDVALPLRRPLALVVYNTLSITPGSPHLPIRRRRCPRRNVLGAADIEWSTRKGPAPRIIEM